MLQSTEDSILQIIDVVDEKQLQLIFIESEAYLVNVHPLSNSMVPL